MHEDLRFRQFIKVALFTLTLKSSKKIRRSRFYLVYEFNIQFEK